MSRAIINNRVRNTVRRRVEQAMLASITIQRGDLGTMDQTTLRVTGITNVQTIYSGKARVRLLQGSGVLAIGENTVDTRQTQITIPIGHTPVPRRDDLVTIIDYSTSDSDTNDRVFRVMEVEGGGIFGYGRVMSCVSWYESRYWEE